MQRVGEFEAERTSPHKVLAEYDDQRPDPASLNNVQLPEPVPSTNACSRGRGCSFESGGRVAELNASPIAQNEVRHRGLQPSGANWMQTPKH
jgi:hypothetical protein